MKKINRILSAICAMTMVSSLLTVPAALADETADLGLGELITDDCTTLNHITASSNEAKVNETHGFIWNSDTTGYGDHYTLLNYGMKGNWEVTFDYFLDDYDKTLSKDSEGNEEVINNVPNLRIADSSGKTFFDNGSGFPNLGWVNNGKMRTWQKDDDTALAIQQYARATRKYGTLEDGDTNPTHLNVKVAIQDSKLSVMAKWNTENTWRTCYNKQNLQSSYSVDTPIAIQLVSCYAGIDNIKVMTQIYDESLLPGINPAGMISKAPKISWKNSGGTVFYEPHYNDGYGTFDALTDDFILSYTFNCIKCGNPKRYGIYYGASPSGVVRSDPTTYNGRIGIGDFWNNSKFMGYFSNSDKATHATYGVYGYPLATITEATGYMAAGNTYDIMLAFIDKNLKFAVKKSTEETWHWYSDDYTGTLNVGNIIIHQDGTTGSYSNVKLWVPEEDYVVAPTFDKENVTAGETVTATAYTANYKTTDDCGKLINAIYKQTADGSWRLNNVVMSEDDTTTTDVKKLTAAVTVPNDGETYKVKAMLWSMETMWPYCNAVELTTAAE